MPADDPIPTDRPIFRRRHRLTHDLEFQAVLRGKLKKSQGPLTLWMLPTSLPEHRLGLSIGRRVGHAVRRTRLKRHLREAFRLERASLPRPDAAAPASYDLVVGARAHEPLSLDDYRAILRALAQQLHRVHAKRARRGADSADESP
ncbi:MAG: ribonuclease P protein component [Phycisphaerales bacterium JB037]